MDRTWKDGDEVELALPMQLHTMSLPDNPKATAFLYGPMVLAGLTPPDAIGLASNKRQDAPITPAGISLNDWRLLADAQKLDDWLRPVKTKSLAFHTVGLNRDVTFRPLYQLVDDTFAVYWLVVDPKGPEYSAIQKTIQSQHEREAQVIDRVIVGDEASEKAHAMHMVEPLLYGHANDDYTDVVKKLEAEGRWIMPNFFAGRPFRQAQKTLSCELQTNGATDTLTVLATIWPAMWPTPEQRTDVWIEGQMLATINGGRNTFSRNTPGRSQPN